MINKYFVFIICIMLIMLTIESYAHKASTETPVHQYLANESKEVWRLIPLEMQDHIKNDIHTDDSFSKRNFEEGDDVITGSGEEDVPITRAFRHFWEPDNPQNGKYNDGINIIGFANMQSSYRIAKAYWEDKVIPLYNRGRKDEAYYWLGRVAHLLEDATVSKELFF